MLCIVFGEPLILESHTWLVFFWWCFHKPISINVISFNVLVESCRSHDSSWLFLYIAKHWPLNLWCVLSGFAKTPTSEMIGHCLKALCFSSYWTLAFKLSGDATTVAFCYNCPYFSTWCRHTPECARTSCSRFCFYRGSHTWWLPNPVHFIRNTWLLIRME